MKKDEKCGEKQGSTDEEYMDKEQGSVGEKNKQDSRQKIYPSMTDQDIKKLAEDMYKGLIFTNVHVERQEDVMMVFMPLILSGEEFIDKLQKNPPGMIYEYIERAGPMAINGMPIFSSCKMVSIEDTKKVFDHYNKIVDAVARV